MSSDWIKYLLLSPCKLMIRLRRAALLQSMLAVGIFNYPKSPFSCVRVQSSVRFGTAPLPQFVAAPANCRMELHSLLLYFLLKLQEVSKPGKPRLEDCLAVLSGAPGSPC